MKFFFGHKLIEFDCRQNEMKIHSRVRLSVGESSKKMSEFYRRKFANCHRINKFHFFLGDSEVPPGVDDTDDGDEEEEEANAC